MTTASSTPAAREQRNSSRILAVGPAQGGVGDSFAMTIATASAAPGLAVDSMRLAESSWAAVSALRLALQLRGRLAQADVVHVEFGSNDRTVFWLGLALMLARRDVTAVVHDFPKLMNRPAVGLLPVNHRWLEWLAHRMLSPLLDGLLERALLRRAGAVCVFSEQAARGYDGRAYGAVRVIPHGDVQQSPRRVPPSESDYALFAGYVGPSKGLDVLLAAWAGMPDHHGLRLVIAGDTSRVDEPRLQTLLAQTSDWEHPPSLLGFIEDEESLQSVIANAAVVVLPYRKSSPASGILVRAMAEGRPVVGTRVPAFAASVREGVDGLLVHPGDEDDLRAKLEVMASDGGLRDRLGSEAQRRAGELFSSKRQLLALISAYAAARRPRTSEEPV